MIARRAGTVVSLGMLIGVISGCGTQLDPRLQPTADLRESCEMGGKTLSDDQIRGILAKIEQRRLQGTRQLDAYDVFYLQCNQDFQKSLDQFDCRFCHTACINQVYDINPLDGP